MIKHFSSVLLLAFATLTFSASAQNKIVVEKNSNTENPTAFLTCSGLSPAFASGLASDLKNSNWFTPTADKTKAQFGIDVKGADNAVTVTISSGATPFAIFNIPLDKVDGSFKQHRVMDEILRRVFKNWKSPFNQKPVLDPAICSSRLAFTAKTGTGREIYVSDFDGGSAFKLTSYGTSAHEADWSPDNRYLLFMVYGKSTTNILQYEVNARQHRILANYPGTNTSPVFSPNGKLAAFVLSKDRTVDLYWISLADRKLGRLTNNGDIEAVPCFSPDGQQVIFTSSSVSAAGKVGRPQLYSMNLAAPGSRKALFGDGVERTTADWSANSGLLVYSKKVGGAYQIAVCDPANPAATEKVVTTAGNWESPSWAPDGRHIVCASGTGHSYSLSIVDAWYGTVNTLRTGTGSTTTPDWSALYK